MELVDLVGEPGGWVVFDSLGVAVPDFDAACASEFD